jgi:hypothetical protein
LRPTPEASAEGLTAKIEADTASPRQMGERGMQYDESDEASVKATLLKALHQLAERSDLSRILQVLKRDGVWKIVRTEIGLECLTSHGEKVGTVRAGSLGAPRPKFDPPIGNLAFSDRATPEELHLWIAAMARSGARGGD